MAERLEAKPAQPLLVREERQKHFLVFVNEAQESSSCVLFSVFHKGVTDHDCLGVS